MNRFADMVPVDMTDSYYFGMTTGQRTCKAFAGMNDEQLTSASQRSWLRVTRSMVVNQQEYRQGFEDGYKQERDGLAHPLPQTDVGYSYNDVNH